MKHLRIGVSALLCLGLFAASAAAQSPADWIKRILDPKEIGVTMPEGAKLNRKLSVDYLSKQDPPVKMAVYTMDLDQIRAASEHFAKTLKVKPEVTGSGELAIHEIDLTGEGDYPKEAKGLRIRIAKSQWIDDKLQITMWYTPPQGGGS